ncbi:uncharacterized protein KY384_002073 [Bacidia gigantensis]|uniref:uncharacterized protein n=1 Tax=Bacidia gigantensis TaxID=2732470 RepID=UPI001D046D8F|nr:uncharacterized protein KY384_002073 [Bacidia gigantensis]KAG8533290.1 hypothetical protein KY384_002073 [Bacidia gigantensis]
MADLPPSEHGSGTARKAQRNPVFQMMGKLLSRIKLPSRNWMIFLSVVGSWTTALAYDRYYKRRAQRKWAEYVAPLAKQVDPSNTMPRKITVILAAPPGDNLREPREHFHEYIKPILVAGAIDWDVIEGRKEGEVRAGLAEKIRKMRERNGEQRFKAGDEGPDLLEALMAVRQAMGVREWEGVQGDLVLGRHTWKEYVRGLHEGWLGPVDQIDHSLGQPPKKEASIETPDQVTKNPDSQDAQVEQHSTSSEAILDVPTEENPETPPKPAPKPSHIPPFIEPSSYFSANLAPTAPAEFSPSTVLPLPHVLGFLNTPKRMYRFLNRRHLAESTGSSVAALVLAAHTRPYQLEYTEQQLVANESETSTAPRTTTITDFPGKMLYIEQYAQHPAVQEDRKREAAKPAEVHDDRLEGLGKNQRPSHNTDSVIPNLVWEQDSVLKDEEPEWHKSAYRPKVEGEEREQLWREDMVIDPRIDRRMSTFVLPEGAREKAEELEGRRRQSDDGYLEKARKWAGYEPGGKRGWEMGFEGDSDK